MFYPFRYDGYAIYDIRHLISPPTLIEERICMEATRRIPQIFNVGLSWGKELREGALWVEETEHDLAYKRIRTNLRENKNYIFELCHRIEIDVENLSNELSKVNCKNLEEFDISSLLDACATAKSWFATNWLHPFLAVKMALCRNIDDGEIEKYLNILLKGELLPTFIQAYTHLADVKDNISDEKFRNQWGGLYALGSQKGALDLSGTAMELSKEQAPTEMELSRILETNKKHAQKRQALVEQLILKEKLRYGEESSQLLQAQIDFISHIIWEEEIRHLLEQQTYSIYRDWLLTSNNKIKNEVSENIPWAQIS